MGNIYCLMWSGPGLTDAIRTALFFAAQDMFKDEVKYKILKSDRYAGEISTEWKSARIGDAFGYVFTAIIDWDDKSSTVQYLVRQVEIHPGERKNLHWMQNPANPNLN